MKRDKWTTRRALTAHVVIAIWFPGCFVAAWWQVTVALSGDSLGYLYSVEWPVFALFGLVVWWNIIHDDPDTVGSRGLELARGHALSVSGLSDPAGPDTTVDDSASTDNPSSIDRGKDEIEALRKLGEGTDDLELAAYNAYLAQLANTTIRKTK